ncbi:unnamed protein product [Gordionus sp. m RMFG-2023]|uniref:uncharacterized protein LOC135923442 n=1 Tax=Gordionus sp. m RMFG-2023 TaxID=3053472 RepID=UPI0030DFACD6
MAKCDSTARDFVLSVFSSNIAILCTHDVEILSQKNKLTFVEMLQKFSQLPLEAQIKDPNGNVLNIQNFYMKFIEMKNQCIQPLIAKKLLNEAVSKYITNVNADDTISIESIMQKDTNITEFSNAPFIEKTILSQNKINCGIYKIMYPLCTPWFDDYRNTFFHVMLCSEHEYLRHFIACIFVVSSNSTDPLADLDNLVKQQLEHQGNRNLPPYSPPTNTQSSNRPNTIDYNKINNPPFPLNSSVSTSSISTTMHHGNYKWFCPNVFHFHVILHDPSEADDSKTQTLYENMKNMYGNHSCHLLRINDYKNSLLTKRVDKRENPILNGGTDIQLKSLEEALLEATSHPLQFSDPLSSQPQESLKSQLNISSTMDFNNTDFNNQSNIDIPKSSNIANVNESIGVKNEGVIDTERLENTDAMDSKNDYNQLAVKNLLTEFCLKGLFPWAERQMRLWNEQIQSRRGLHKSFISATKKWFSVGKNPATNTSYPSQQNASTSVLYNFDSLELQTRQLADLSFLFQCFQTAYSLYHTAKKDFQSDQAWIYYAGAVEMAGISSYMLGTIATQFPFHYLDSAINTYLSVCNLPIFATRATLFSTEILKSFGFYTEAAMNFLKLTSEESDLRSALFLEQSALCFLKIKNNHNRNPMIRKYGFHLILAGNKYFKISDENSNSTYQNHQNRHLIAFKYHGLRCYNLARNIFKDTQGWIFLNDHITFTLAKHLWTRRPLASLSDDPTSIKNDAQSNFDTLTKSEKYLASLFKLNRVYYESSCHDNNGINCETLSNFFGCHKPFVGIDSDVKSHSVSTQTKYFKELIALYNELRNTNSMYDIDIPVPIIDCPNIKISLPDVLYENYPENAASQTCPTNLANSLERFCYKSASDSLLKDITNNDTNLNSNTPVPTNLRHFSSHYDNSTCNQEPCIVFANESFRIDVPIQNTYKLPLVLSGLQLTGHFSDNASFIIQSNKITTRTFEDIGDSELCGNESSNTSSTNIPKSYNEDRKIVELNSVIQREISALKENIIKPYLQNKDYDNIQQWVQVEPMGDILVPAQQTKLISLYLTPGKIGYFRIDGFKYRLVFPFPASVGSKPPSTNFNQTVSPLKSESVFTRNSYDESSNNPENSSTGYTSAKPFITVKRCVMCPGKRLNATNHQKKTLTYSIDKRLEFYVRPPIPFLKGELKGLPSIIYDGQLIEDCYLEIASDIRQSAPTNILFPNNLNGINLSPPSLPIHVIVASDNKLAHSYAATVTDCRKFPRIPTILHAYTSDNTTFNQVKAKNDRIEVDGGDNYDQSRYIVSKDCDKIYFPISLYNNLMARASGIVQEDDNPQIFEEEEDHCINKANQNFLADRNKLTSTTNSNQHILKEEDEIRCDLIIFNYSQYEANNNVINDDHLINYRAFSIPIRVKSYPSISIKTQIVVSQLDIRDVNVFLDMQNMTKETDDKIMEISVHKIILVSSSYKFLSINSNSQGMNDFKIKPCEHMRICIKGKHLEDNKAILFSDITSNIITTQSGKLLSNCDNISPKFTRMLNKCNQFLRLSTKGRAISLYIHWTGLMVDENGARNDVHGVHSFQDILPPCLYRLPTLPPFFKEIANHSNANTPVIDKIFAYSLRFPTLSISNDVVKNFRLELHLSNLSQTVSLYIDISVSEPNPNLSNGSFLYTWVGKTRHENIHLPPLAIVDIPLRAALIIREYSSISQFSTSWRNTLKIENIHLDLKAFDANNKGGRIVNIGKISVGEVAIDASSGMGEANNVESEYSLCNSCFVQIE